MTKISTSRHTSLALAMRKCVKHYSENSPLVPSYNFHLYLNYDVKQIVGSVRKTVRNEVNMR